jgi:hypothetical protein
MSSPSSVPFVTNGDYYTTLSQKSKIVTLAGTRSAQGIRLQFRLVEILGEWANCCVFYHNFTHQANLTASLKQYLRSFRRSQIAPAACTACTACAAIVAQQWWTTHFGEPSAFTRSSQHVRQGLLTAAAKGSVGDPHPAENVFDVSSVEPSSGLNADCGPLPVRSCPSHPR